ncbi:MAG: hypothetical protein IJJ33_12200 [Victivallales bacterium]|nr:hypothetical protein [Victivallales bacterium]
MKTASVVFDQETWDEIEHVKKVRRTRSTSQVIREALHAYSVFLTQNIDKVIPYRQGDNQATQKEEQK